MKKFKNQRISIINQMSMMIKNYVKPLFLMLLMAIALTGHAQENNSLTKQENFEQFFGEYAALDPEMVEKVKADKPGKRHYVDKDGDGKPEEVWFLDVDPRHNKENSPILVRVIDEDKDLFMGREPDRDSDLYVADWNADGSVDVIIDYEDNDGDNDVDQMAMYFTGPTYSSDRRKLGLRAWYSRDDGDDNLLWYDVDYKYYQHLSQVKTHFGGDETFISMYYDADNKRWVTWFENPFLFFDCNMDGITEEVIRVSGEADLIRTARWSFDADNNATHEKPRNFDVGVTLLAPGWTEQSNDYDLHYGDNESEYLTLRGTPAGPVLNRRSARQFLQNITWARVLYTWDEIDLNIAWNDPEDTIERWEGIIAAPSNDSNFFMPVVGAPNCGPFNKHYELVLHPDNENEYYFNPAEHRLHLKNNDKSWLKVDYDGDAKMDMQYQWSDKNRDGIMDHLYIDVNGDDSFEDSVIIDISGVKPINWTFEEIHTVYSKNIAKIEEKKFILVQLLLSVPGSQGSPSVDPVFQFIENKFEGGGFPGDLADRLIKSNRTINYYLTLVQDRQISKLKQQKAGSESFWKDFLQARSVGDYDAMIRTVTNEFGVKIADEDYNSWISQLRQEPIRKQVAWGNHWLPPNWGWESEKAAFRFYDGHFDLFGKRLDSLIIPSLGTGKSYHRDHNLWGMDILHAGKTSGSGGVTLYVNGVGYPVRKEQGSDDPVFTNKLIEERYDKVILEFLAEGVGPKNAPYRVRIRPSAIAGRFDSPVEVLVEGGKPEDELELGIGLTRLPEETFMLDRKTGVMGTWGFQEPEIGWMGMGIIFPSQRFERMEHQEKEHQVIISCEANTPIVYHIQGDWLRGHHFSCCPGADEWLKKLRDTQINYYNK